MPTSKPGFTITAKYPSAAAAAAAARGVVPLLAIVGDVCDVISNAPASAGDSNGAAAISEVLIVAMAWRACSERYSRTLRLEVKCTEDFLGLAVVMVDVSLRNGEERRNAQARRPAL